MFHHEAVPPLLVRVHVYSNDRPCTITMVVSTKDGGASLSLGFGFTRIKIVHRKGTLNGNADALSCCPHPVTTSLPVAITTTTEPTTALRQAQLEDSILQQVQQALSHGNPNISSWHNSSLRRYLQLWHQLSNVDGVICRMYQPGPASDVVKPLIPTSLQQNALQQSHDLPSAEYQGTAKTLA